MDAESVDQVGIIYSKETAETVYGGVIERLNLKSADLYTIAEQSGSYIMFHIMDGLLIITDEKRNLLHPADAEFPGDTVFHYFSTSKLFELLKIGDAQATSIELRRDVLSITNGNFTLENAKPCPPYCP